MSDASLFPPCGDDDGPEGLVDFLVGLTAVLAEADDLAHCIVDAGPCSHPGSDSVEPGRGEPGEMLDVFLGLVALHQRWRRAVELLPSPGLVDAPSESAGAILR